MAGFILAAQEWPYSNYVDVIANRENEFKDTSLVPKRFMNGDDYRQFVETQSHGGQKIEELNRYLLD